MSTHVYVSQVEAGTGSRLHPEVGQVKMRVSSLNTCVTVRWRERERCLAFARCQNLFRYDLLNEESLQV